MNHQTWSRVGVRVAALMFVVAGAAACGERDERMSSTESTANGSTDASVSERAERSGLPSDASPSAVVIGTAPAQPTEDPAATTSPAGGRSELSKAEQSAGMPNEGDVHSYSTTAKSSPQKAGGTDPVSQESKP